MPKTFLWVDLLLSMLIFIFRTEIVQSGDIEYGCFFIQRKSFDRRFSITTMNIFRKSAWHTLQRVSFDRTIFVLMTGENVKRIRSLASLETVQTLWSNYRFTISKKELWDVIVKFSRLCFSWGNYKLIKQEESLNNNRNA